MKKIRVKLKPINCSYKILIGSGLLKKLPNDLKRKPIANKYVIITDSNIKKIYGKKLLNYFRSSQIKCHLLFFKAGEENKSQETVNYLYNKLLKLRLGRDSAIIALGGGVTGDVAGFMAATLYRGIPYIQVPTSLLAQVDSSVGGKVGINHSLGKNLIGAFHQPKAVYIDVATLKTLPKQETSNGLAEIIKHAIIVDPKFFIFIEKNLKKILSLDSKIIEGLIWRNCQIKSDIVESDEKEKGPRKVLNFGHTIGHAIESLSNYKIAHGKAVAIGMAAETKIAEQIGLINNAEAQSIIRLMKKAKFSLGLPRSISVREIIKQTRLDKKSVGDIPEYVLPLKVGKMKYNMKVKDKIIESVLEKMK